MKKKNVTDSEKFRFLGNTYTKYSVQDPTYHTELLSADSLLGIDVMYDFLMEAEAHGKRIVLHEGINPALGYWDAWLSIE